MGRWGWGLLGCGGGLGGRRRGRWGCGGGGASLGGRGWGGVELGGRSRSNGPLTSYWLPPRDVPSAEGHAWSGATGGRSGVAGGGPGAVGGRRPSCGHPWIPRIAGDPEKLRAPFDSALTPRTVSRRTPSPRGVATLSILRTPPLRSQLFANNSRLPRLLPSQSSESPRTGALTLTHTQSNDPCPRKTSRSSSKPSNRTPPCRRSSRPRGLTPWRSPRRRVFRLRRPS